MLLRRNEFEDLARLRPGEAYLFTNGYYKAQKIRTPNLHANMDLRPLSDEELLGIIRDEPWFVETSTARCEMQIQMLSAAMNLFDEHRLASTADAATLLAEYAHAKALARPSHRNEALRAIRTRAVRVRQGLEDSHRQFRRRDYLPLLPPMDNDCAVSDELNAMRTDLDLRYTTVVQPDTQQCLEILDRLIRLCGGTITKTTDS
jgi:hypothetical protein